MNVVCLFVCLSSLPLSLENVRSVIGHSSYADTFNPLTPNSDQHHQLSSCLLNKFSLSVPMENGEYAYWVLGVNGWKWKTNKQQQQNNKDSVYTAIKGELNATLF